MKDRRLGPLTVVLLLAGCQATPPSAYNEAPLILTFAGGVADSQVIPVDVNGVPAWLALDTGSEGTFLYRGPDDPPYVADAGAVRIGSRVIHVPGYGAEGIGPEMFLGKPILGILGADFFLPRGEIDYPGGRVVAWGTEPIPGASELPGLPLRVVDGLARVKVRMDGRDLDLMFDTGAHHTVLLGVDGEPGDEPVAVQTADGVVHPAHAGTASIRLPRELPQRVPVLRALEIPYISPWLVDEQGANGLLGLTSIGLRRVIFDGNRLLLGPRTPL